MYAVVEIKGKQFKVTDGAELSIPKTEAEEGDTLKYDRVLYLHDGKSPVVGTPVVDGAYVEATVLRHGKAKKVLVFKKKRRTGYKKKRGHRQQFTSIRIDKIAATKKSSPKKKSTAKKAASQSKKDDAGNSNEE